MKTAIPGHPGYFITRNGAVWSAISKKWLKRAFHPDGYPQVTLGRNSEGMNITRKVHRLVALTYLPNPNNWPCVNHKDGNKVNSRDTNLEWCTQQHNVLHAWRTGLNVRTPAMLAHSIASMRALARKSRKVTMEIAQRIRERVAAGELKTHVGRDYGLSYWSVRDIVAGDTYVS